MPTLSITLNAANAQRVVVAFGKKLNLQDMTDPDNPVPRNATEEEVRQEIKSFIKGVVFAQEPVPDVEIT
jgi:hypothetical protein